MGYPFLCLFIYPSVSEMPLLFPELPASLPTLFPFMPSRRFLFALETSNLSGPLGAVNKNPLFPIL